MAISDDSIVKKVLVLREVKYVESKWYYKKKNWNYLKDLSQTSSDKETF